MKSRLNVQELVARLKSALPEYEQPLALHEPRFQGNEWSYVKDCLDSGWVSSVGEYVNRFEQMLAEYAGVSHAVAVVNGTAALHISLLMVGVKDKEEVIIPSLTFIATANAISYCGAIPLFADVEETTLGIDASKLDAFLIDVAEIRDGLCFNRRSGRRIAALMPMHTFGHPVDIEALLHISEKWHLPLVEDAAESLGSLYKGRHTGSFGKVSGLSFNGNKIITTGGGGAILTNDSELAKLAKHLTTTARVPHKWSFMHDMVGYNYRLPNINAALGCAQMESLPEYVERKRELAGRYAKVLDGLEGVRFMHEPEYSQSNYWLNALLLDCADFAHRDDVLGQLNEAGLTARPAWILLHKLPMFSNCPQMDLSVAEELEKRIINIPSSVILG